MDNMTSLVSAEKQLDCRKLIHHFDIERVKHQCSIELYARVIFILVDNLAEGMDETEPVDYYLERMLEYYQESSLLYGENPDYQFLLGFIMSKGEWYFGITDFNDVTLMQKKPYQTHPDNKLYEWLFLGYGNPQVQGVAQQLITERSGPFIWLESLGILGWYTVGIIEASAMRS